MSPFVARYTEAYENANARQTVEEQAQRLPSQIHFKFLFAANAEFLKDRKNDPIVETKCVCI